jgi:hypothetical protein
MRLDFGEAPVLRVGCTSGTVLQYLVVQGNNTRTVPDTPTILVHTTSRARRYGDDADNPDPAHNIPYLSGSNTSGTSTR